MASNARGLGLIGCGDFGLFCLDAYRTMDRVRIAAVADVRQQVADRFAERYSVQAHYDADALIARDDVDIVHVATPPSSHHELVIKALRAGKHVLCEKPLAMTVDQANEMLDLAREKDLMCPVNFVLRYNPVTEAVKAVLDSGALGKVLSGRLTNCAGDSKLGVDHWFWNRQVGGGIFIEHGVHFFDLYRYWLGDGHAISAHIEPREGTGQEDRFHCMVRHDDGALVSHYHGFDQVGLMDRTDHRMVCELGDVRVDGWIPLEITVDAAVDEDALAKLQAALPNAQIETLAEWDPETTGVVAGRGQQRKLSKRVRMHWTPDADKQKVYANSVKDLLADQLDWLDEASHQRTVSEANGLAAVELAEAATNLADMR